MRLVGYFCGWGEERDYYSDGKQFFSENGDLLSENQLKDWALWLNSPWSFVNANYVIGYNCKDRYSRVGEGEPTWKCEYTVVGYDGITSSVIGYSFESEEDALIKCKQLFSLLQKEYNPDGDAA